MTHEYPSNSSELDTIDNFVRYTHPHCTDAHEHQLPSEFDLSFLRPHIDELYDFVPHGPSMGTTTHEDNQTDTTNVERGSYLYLDQTDGRVKPTDITSGTYDSVKLDFMKYHQKGGLSIMCIHTHPEDALFSPRDHISLCQSEKDRRRSKASLVLCPTIQVLALATANTPKMNFLQCEEFASKWENDFYQRLESIDKEEAKLREHLTQTGWNENILSFIREQPYQIKRAQIANQVLVELSRAINIKMYVSTNRQHFQAAN